MSEETVTHAQRMVIRREECSAHGHTLAPVTVLCHQCGTSWRIHPDDAGKNFDLPDGQR